MNQNKAIIVGGWCLVAFTILYFGMQFVLALVYDYPNILVGGTISQSAAALHAGGNSLRFMLTIYSITPLLVIPAITGAYYALRKHGEAPMLLSILFAMLAVLGLMLTLMQAPSINWSIAEFYLKVNADLQTVMDATLLALNNFFSLFVGEFISKLSLIITICLLSFTALKCPQFPRWISYLGFITAIYLLITMQGSFGIYPPVLHQFARRFVAIEPIWLFSFGTAMIMFKE